MTSFVDKNGETCYLLKLEDLRPLHENDGNILLQTIVAGQSEIEHYAIKIVYQCPNFGNCSTEICKVVSGSHPFLSFTIIV